MRGCVCVCVCVTKNTFSTSTESFPSSRATSLKVQDQFTCPIFGEVVPSALTCFRAHGALDEFRGLILAGFHPLNLRRMACTTAVSFRHYCTDKRKHCSTAEPVTTGPDGLTKNVKMQINQYEQSQKANECPLFEYDDG